MPRARGTARGDRDVVVGVDGTPASINAARYAKKEAGRCRSALEIVHVVPEIVPIAGLLPIPPDDAVPAGRSVLHAALDRLDDVEEDVAVITHLRRGSVVATLAAAGEGARSVVVGSDRRPAPMRLLTGNVTTGVAARSPAPVVSVPETWSPDLTQGVVVVGVKHPDHAESLLAEAFELARERGSRLVVLHSWLPRHAFERLEPDRSALERQEAEALDELRAVVAPWRERFPEVDVELRSAQDEPAHALVMASTQADELVIARRAHGFPAAAHLGSTARTVLLYAHCPVRVVPASQVPLASDLELESAGAALK